MLEKRERIFAAAAELFQERGFAAVTTQEISERADVAAGTLFRYAATKGELLLMVYNELLRASVEEGRRAAAERGDTADAVYAMVAPIVTDAARAPENATAYQRELLFGPPTEQYRGAGLELIAEIERSIAARLLADHPATGADAARLAAASVFAVTHLAIARNSTGAHAHHDTLDDLRTQIAQLVAGARTGTPAR
ncbi:TetR/AcrR family transcriptional regulator [Protaetiibacter intestinalis]|uniref:TetR/AcrR family transcriptional regulator n=2 Tax=Protaetiibacter intestinalis TaxID=2419774 RepID=A0A387BCE6_9MICO|nr:TetR/AcrR family transcriptional regulator [Protaetiibacter intestinalis]